jgi:hypothetical protein
MPDLALRVREAARIDGISQSQAAARAVSCGVLLSPAARRNLRFLLAEGGPDAERDLADALSRAVAQVANDAIKKQLLDQARKAGTEPPAEAAILDEAAAAVRRHRNRQSAAPSGSEKAPAFGD